MEGTAGTPPVPEWVTAEDWELYEKWREYAYDNSQWVNLTDKFSECLWFSHGGVEFRYMNPRKDEKPCILRLRGDTLNFRINLGLPDDHEDAWHEAGMVKKVQGEAV